MAKVLDKMMGLLGMDEEYEEYEEEKDEIEESAEELKTINFNTKKSNKVVNIHSTGNAKVTIIKPKEYDEATNICDDLRNRKIVVVNTNDIDNLTGQRLLDFLGGATYALDAELQQIDKGVYILTPSNVDVDNAFKDELSNKGLFRFVK